VRNAYLLIDFGSFVDGATPGTNAPYIQLLPITNASDASSDFAQVRLNNGSDVDDLNSLASHSSTTTTTTKTTTTTSNSTLPTWVIGVIFGVIISAFLLGICVYYCCRRRRSQRVSSTPSYRPLYDPSPQGAYDMHLAPNANPAYAPEYKSAWDAHY
jgi:hypothetical protein